MSCLLFVLLITIIKNSSSSSSSWTSSSWKSSSKSSKKEDYSKCPCWKSKDIVKICKREDSCVFGDNEFYSGSVVGSSVGQTLHCGDNFFRHQSAGINAGFTNITCTINEVDKKGKQCKKTFKSFTNVDNICETEIGDALADPKLDCRFEFCGAGQGGACDDNSGCVNGDGVCLTIASSRTLGCADIACPTGTACPGPICWLDDDCPDGEYCWIGGYTMGCSGATDAECTDPAVNDLGICAPRCVPPLPLPARSVPVNDLEETDLEEAGLEEIDLKEIDLEELTFDDGNKTIEVSMDLPTTIFLCVIFGIIMIVTGLFCIDFNKCCDMKNSISI